MRTFPVYRLPTFYD